MTKGHIQCNRCASPEDSYQCGYQNQAKALVQTSEGPPDNKGNRLDHRKATSSSGIQPFGSIVRGHASEPVCTRNTPGADAPLGALPLPNAALGRNPSRTERHSVLQGCPRRARILWTKPLKGCQKTGSSRPCAGADRPQGPGLPAFRSLRTETGMGVVAASKERSRLTRNGQQNLPRR